MDQPLPEFVTCLSLDQPYAGLVALGLKDETRLYPWPVKKRPYPAPLLICSTLRRPAWSADFAARLRRDGLMFGDHWKRGVALALVDVVSCRHLTEQDLGRSWYWDPAQDKGRTRYLWRLCNVRPVRPFPVSGRQGFGRRVERAVIKQAMA